MRIQHNISALNNHRNLSFNSTNANKALEKLSSGYKINRAGDDAAGLAISEKMRGQIRGLDMASKNAQDGISFIQTAEGALHEVHSLLQRGRELAVQAANDTNVESEREALQLEINAINEEIDRIGSNTEFNTKKLFGGNARGDSIPRVPGIPGVTYSPSSGTAISGFPGGLNSVKQLEAALNSQYLPQAAKMIEDYYGLRADGSDLSIKIREFNDSTVAFVSYYYGANGKGENLELYLDLQDFANADKYNSGTQSPFYNDRIVAHEMAHAVMARTTNFASLPTWFIEGTAEFIHGADERVYAHTFYEGASGIVGSIGNGTDSSWRNTSVQYASGYVAVRYLHDDLKAKGYTNGIKDLFNVMKTNDGSGLPTLDQALKKVGYSGGTAEFINKYKANGVNYINNMKLTDSDTGAIGGENADGGAIKTAENVVADTSDFSNNNPDVGFNLKYGESDFSWGDFWNSYADISAFSNITSSEEVILQIGSNSDQSITVSLSSVTAESLGISDVDIINNSTLAISSYDQAIENVSLERGRYGAIQNRLEHTLLNLETTSENLSASESRIRDTHMAKEMMNFTKQNILIQAAQSMLSQANQQPQGVLQLLG